MRRLSHPWLWIGACLGMVYCQSVMAQTTQPLQVPVIGGIPAFVIGSAPGMTTWNVSRSFAAPPHGMFMSFEDLDANGVRVSSAWFNPGTLAGAGNTREGDIDLGIVHLGQDVVISISGSWQGAAPGLMVWPPDLMWIGSATNRYAGIGMTQVACPKSCPGKPAYCYRTPDGFIPVYK